MTPWVYVSVASALLPLAAAPLYTLTDLGVGYRPSAINANRVVAGTHRDAGGTERGFAWQSGLFSLVGEGTRVFDIDDDGRMAGVTLDGSGNTTATVWTGGDTASAVGGTGSSATALTPGGGPAAGSAGGRAAVFPGTLGVTGEWSAAYDVNGSGVAVGTTRLANGSFRAFRYRPEAGAMLLPLLGGSSNYGIAVNEAGQIAGNATTATGHLEAFLWDSGTLRGLGTLGGSASAAAGLNGAATVVGWSTNARGEQRAFAWLNGVMVDLNGLIGTEGWRLVEATAVSSRGQIAGVGFFGGEMRGFLLDPSFDPQQEPPVANPEPATISMILVGGILFVAGARGRRR